MVVQTKSSYPLVVAEAKKLAEQLGVKVPAELLVQHGPPPDRASLPPADRFEAVLVALGSLLMKANEVASFEEVMKVKKPPVDSKPSKASKK